MKEGDYSVERLNPDGSAATTKFRVRKSEPTLICLQFIQAVRLLCANGKIATINVVYKELVEVNEKIDPKGITGISGFTRPGIRLTLKTPIEKSTATLLPIDQ